MRPDRHNLSPIKAASSGPHVNIDLFSALSADPATRPERLNATLGRVGEALEIVNGSDGSTFGGNPMAMTAALIATRQMKKLNRPALAHSRGQQIENALTELGSPRVMGWRVFGLMVGIDLESADAVSAV